MTQIKPNKDMKILKNLKLRKYFYFIANHNIT